MKNKLLILISEDEVCANCNWRSKSKFLLSLLMRIPNRAKVSEGEALSAAVVGTAKGEGAKVRSRMSSSEARLTLMATASWIRLRLFLELKA